ncbi:MAG: ABC transporter permease [Lachnospiraceae bacterium]|jgi:ABC-2 type transport system permease protein|nr:ABC transporter permease [Lachnospiraceae bacterium]
MFIKQFIYSLKYTIKSYALTFWTILFPILLATMMFLGFGNMLNSEPKFNPVKTAIVTENNGKYTKDFTAMTKEMEKGSSPLINVKNTSEKEAKKLLSKNKIIGYYLVGDNISLVVSKTGINQSILNEIQNSFLRNYNLIENILKTNPKSISTVTEQISKDTSHLKEISFSKSKSTGNVQYFYALLAMTCLYAAFFGVYIVGQIQADQSDLAIRRVMSPIRKLPTVLIDCLSAFTINIASLIILFVYLRFVMKVDFGSHLGLTFLTTAIGSICGLSLGLFIGAIIKKSPDAKVGLTVGITMVLSFLSGLMFSAMPNIIEKHLPIVNRLNPAMLIANSFYCLTFYNNYALYFRNIVTLIALSIILLLASVLLLRRNRYASI